MRALVLEQTDPDVEEEGAEETEAEGAVPQAVLELPSSLESDPNPSEVALFWRYGSSLTASR